MSRKLLFHRLFNLLLNFFSIFLPFFFAKKVAYFGNMQ